MKHFLPHTIGDALRACCNKFGEPFTAQKKALMEESLSGHFNHAPSLLRFFDALLFIQAYPENAEQYELAGEAILHIREQLLEQRASGSYFPEKLNGSGLAGSTQLLAPSVDLLGQLLALSSESPLIDSTNADNGKVTEILKLLLPVQVHEHLENRNETLAQRAKNSGREKDSAAWLLELFRAKKLPEDVTDQLFASLGTYFSLPMGPESFAKDLLQFPLAKPFLHREGLQKQVDAKRILNQSVKPAEKLSAGEKDFYIAASRLKLALLNRETDPVTYCSQDDVFAYDMGRGFTIMLFGLKPSRRLAIETYIGYMAFKNGWPIAYGGAWMFGHSAKIGVNIFEEFRGGESAWIFCQLMRLYRQLYGVRRFIVEPYQYGKHNPEGIHSGAFWFYYRLGYRPADEKLRKLAEEEWDKISADKLYRSPVSVLKAFTHANIELAVDRQAPAAIDPSSFSRPLAALFASLGNDAEAIIRKTISGHTGISFKGWTADEKQGFRLLAPLLCLIPDLPGWSIAERRSLAKLLRAKGGKTEKEYLLLLKKHPKLLHALAAIKPV